MRRLLYMILCGYLLSAASLNSTEIQTYIKGFVDDVLELENEAILKKYFVDIEYKEYVHVEREYVIKTYTEKLIEIRARINPKKNILIEEIESRVYKVSQKDYFFHLKLKENIDLLESIIPVKKGEKIIDWL